MMLQDAMSGREKSESLRRIATGSDRHTPYSSMGEVDRARYWSLGVRTSGLTGLPVSLPVPTGPTGLPVHTWQPASGPPALTPALVKYPQLTLW